MMNQFFKDVFEELKLSWLNINCLQIMFKRYFVSYFIFIIERRCYKCRNKWDFVNIQVFIKYLANKWSVNDFTNEH